MIPFQAFAGYTPPEEFNPSGVQIMAGDTIWKKTWNDGVETATGQSAHGQRYQWLPYLWDDALAGLNLLPGQYHPHFPEFAQLVRVARRTATVDSDFPDTADYYESLESAKAAAISGLSAWTADDPYDPEADISSGTSLDDVTYNEDDTYTITVTAWESKYRIRWAPPFSARAKVRAEIYGGETTENVDVTWNGAAGITLGGVQRCFPAEIVSPITDAMWIYDPYGERTLEALPDANRWVLLTFQTPFRHVPLPP